MNPTTKVDLNYYDHKILFAISSCSTNKRYSLVGLNREEVKMIIERLQHVEKMSWKQFANLMVRGDGLTVEKRDAESYFLINECDRSPTKNIENYYFHLRIEKTGKSRIFGYQYRDKFYITHLDMNGDLHH